jgi:hypothetical protein
MLKTNKNLQKDTGAKGAMQPYQFTFLVYHDTKSSNLIVGKLNHMQVFEEWSVGLVFKKGCTWDS